MNTGSIDPPRCSVPAGRPVWSALHLARPGAAFTLRAWALLLGGYVVVLRTAWRRPE